MAIEETINQAADKLVHAIEVYGPKATDLALETGRVSAIANLVESGVGVFLGGAIIFGCYKAIRLSIRKVEVDEVDEEGPWIALGVASAVVGIFAAIICLVRLVGLFDVWSWVGLSHPDIYLAHKMLKI